MGQHVDAAKPITEAEMEEEGFDYDVVASQRTQEEKGKAKTRHTFYQKSSTAWYREAKSTTCSRKQRY